MFTPQRSARSLKSRVSSDNTRTKGKGVAGSLDSATPPPPPLGGERGSGREDMEAWKRFREEGLLDESVFYKKDREALASRICELESDLHEYQYNMGLLLIEKKEWSQNIENMRLRLSEAEEILKREQAAHIIALAESEKREDNLRKALGVEKQCVTDLEKTFREMRSEIAEAKFTSEKKMADALALDASIEEKYLEVERKLHSADAKLAEVNRKSSEIERKLEDVEARERKVHREMLSLNSERNSLDKDISEQREHLREWEKKLQDGQNRLLDGQRCINEREERINEADKVLKKKEDELEEARKLIEGTRSTLKNKEEDLDIRLRALASKEKDTDLKLKNLEKKEKELLEIEEKLNAREREEIQKLLDEHNAILDAKKKEFELELEERRKSIDEEMKSKLAAVDKEKKEFNRKAEQINKREQALESKMEKIKIKERDLDAKSKALKKWEESVKSNEKKLKEEKDQLMKDRHELNVSITELQTLRDSMKAEKQQVIEEREKLKLTQEERGQHVQLQSKLKQEIEEYRTMKESLSKETESLREEREKFEKEWESLDEKRLELQTEIKKVHDERERLEKWHHNEQERLKNEEMKAKADIERQLEDIKLQKDAFADIMEHERSMAQEDVSRQLADVTRELELRKHELEMNMQKKQEDMEKKLEEKEKDIERLREVELNRITSLNNLNDSKLQKLKVEQDRLEIEKEEVSLQKKKLEEDRVEIQKDIDTLRMLSKNLKDQRAEFVKEKVRFLAAAERCKTCHNCGVSLSELELLGIIQPSTEIENADILLPSLAVNYDEEHMKIKKTPVLSPQGTSSQSFGSGFLQKCSKIFKFSPGKNDEQSTEALTEKPFEFGERLDMLASEDATTNNNSIDVVRMNDNSPAIPAAPAVEQNGTGDSSEPLENDSQPKQRGGRQSSQRGRGANLVKRTRSVKAVVEDAKAILGESLNGGDTKDSSLHMIDEESQGASVQTGTNYNTRQKRRRPPTSEMTNSEMEPEDSEGQSQSVSVGGARRKKRQISTATGTQTLPGERRYNLRHNLRRSTIANSVAATQAASDQAKGQKATASHQTSHDDDEIAKVDNHALEGTSKNGVAISPSSGFVDENSKVMHVLHKSTTSSVMEVSSKHEMVKFDEESDAIKSIDISERSTGENGDVVDGALASEPGTPSNVSSATEDGEDNMDDEGKHNASIGKKLWKFFTT